MAGPAGTADTLLETIAPAEAGAELPGGEDAARMAEPPDPEPGAAYSGRAPAGAATGIAPAFAGPR